MKKILLITAGLLAFASTPAMAQNSGLEAHIGISMYENNDFTGVQGRLGYVHDIGSFMIGVEGEVGTAFTDISETVFDPEIGNVTVDLGLDSNAGVMAFSDLIATHNSASSVVLGIIPQHLVRRLVTIKSEMLM